MAESARSRSFGPVVLGGLVTSGLAALAATRPWYDTGRVATLPGMGADLEQTYPAASAVSLVLLAAWGVLLVTRGRVRRLFAALAVLGGLGLVATAVAAAADRPDGDPALTGWFWVGVLAALLAVVPAVLAVRLVPTWPEMGSRYDAPAADTPPRVAGEPMEERELWRSLDEGHDPTDDTTGPERDR